MFYLGPYNPVCNKTYNYTTGYFVSPQGTAECKICQFFNSPLFLNVIYVCSTVYQGLFIYFSLFITRLQKAEKKQHKGPKDPKDTSAAKSQSEDEESLVDDEDMEQDSDDSAEEGAKKPAKKTVAAKQNEKADDAKKGKPKDDKFFLFIGNLPTDITDDVVCF